MCCRSGHIFEHTAISTNEMPYSMACLLGAMWLMSLAERSGEGGPRKGRGYLRKFALFVHNMDVILL